MFCLLHVKISETRLMGLELTCGKNLFQDFTGLYPNLLFIIIWSLMQVTLLLEQTGPRVLCFNHCYKGT